MMPSIVLLQAMIVVMALLPAYIADLIGAVVIVMTILAAFIAVFAALAGGAEIVLMAQFSASARPVVSISRARIMLISFFIGFRLL